MKSEIFNRDCNPAGKLVVFSESVDTLNYLEEQLSHQLERSDILKVTSDNRDYIKQTIRDCFDANYNEGQDINKYNIILASDVLAEGVNLHRANVIVNYDTPWNATRLMQRIGRVNRIGSTAEAIYNYMFYPSPQGNTQIQLYQNALIKLQGFHSALGEDAKIYSHEEVIKEFKLFNPDVQDETDKNLQLLREVREVYNHDIALYKKIKALPLKSRAARAKNKAAPSGTTLTFVKSNRKTEYYLIKDDSKPESIDFLAAADIMRADVNEKAIDFSNVKDYHYKHVSATVEAFKTEIIVQQDVIDINQAVKDKRTLEALNFLRRYESCITDSDVRQQILVLKEHINAGAFAGLIKQVRDLAKKYREKNVSLNDWQDEIDEQIRDLYRQYGPTTSASQSSDDETEPSIIISESFK